MYSLFCKESGSCLREDLDSTCFGRSSSVTAIRTVKDVPDRPSYEREVGGDVAYKKATNMMCKLDGYYLSEVVSETMCGS